MTTIVYIFCFPHFHQGIWKKIAKLAFRSPLFHYLFRLYQCSIHTGRHCLFIGKNFSVDSWINIAAGRITEWICFCFYFRNLWRLTASSCKQWKQKNRKKLAEHLLNPGRKFWCTSIKNFISEFPFTIKNIFKNIFLKMFALKNICCIMELFLKKFGMKNLFWNKILTR